MLLGNGQIRMFEGILSRTRQPEVGFFSSLHVTSLNAAKFVLLGVFAPIEAICQKFL